jgi:hypothetical protein
MTRRIPQERRVDKLVQVTEAIRDAGWRSFNDFQLAFYTNDDPAVIQQARTSLRYISGKTFAPDVLLDAWLEHGPPGESRLELKKNLTRKAAAVLVTESTLACRSPDLRLPTTELDNKYLANNFALETLATLYLRILPCLWLLLHILLTAPNDYELKHKQVKKDKEEMSRRVSGILLQSIRLLLIPPHRSLSSLSAWSCTRGIEPRTCSRSS